jgi:type II secretory pathway component GspD/PulD (secretin)
MENLFLCHSRKTSLRKRHSYVFPKDGTKKSAPSGAAPVVVAHEINVALTPDGTLLMKVENGDVRSVLLKLSALSGRNLILSPEVQGNLSLNLSGVTFDGALGAIVSSLNLAYEVQGNMIQLRSQTESVAMKHREVRVFHLSYLTSQQAKAYILGVISERGSIMTADGEMTQSLTLEEKQSESEDAASSGDISSFTATDDSLVVHDYRENLDKISDIIKRTDIRPDQVLIEATILSALLTDDTSLGVSFDAVMGSNFTDFVDTVGETTTDMLGGMNVPVTERRNLDYNTGRVNQGSNIGDMNGKNPFRLGVLMGDVSVFVEALDSVTDITVIATPRLHQKTREPIDPKELDRQRKTRGKLGVRGDLRWNQSRLISDRHLQRSQQALRDGKPALARWASHLAHGVRPELPATIESQGETARSSFWTTRAEEAIKHQHVAELLNQEITRETNQ